SRSPSSSSTSSSTSPTGCSIPAWGGKDERAVSLPDRRAPEPCAGAPTPSPMTAWARFCRNRLALLGLVLVVVLALSAALAPWLAPLDPARQSLIEKRTRPGAKYLLGADEFGRDILSRVIYGSRVALRARSARRAERSCAGTSCRT